MKTRKTRKGGREERKKERKKERKGKISNFLLKKKV